MQEEQDTCRICSAPAEPEQPLFYPCKCSGTIRYIHQDCLTEWLAHSKKKTCDVCKHPYSFTKVYSKDMPERLPILLVMRQFSRQIVSAILFGLRAALVATVWLAALPWSTIWTWRMYFALGNSAAWWISAVKRDASDVDFYPATVPNSSTVNATSTNTTDAQPSSSPSLFSHPLYRTISSDIFSGQIIASIIVLTFVAIFLLREWITQNARPGVFEDGDAGVEPVADALPPLPELPQPQPPVHLAPPALPRPPSPPPIVAELVHERAIPIRDDRYVPRDDLPFQARTKKPRTRGDVYASEDSQEAGPSHVGKGKRRAHTTAREERRTLRRRRIGRRTRMFDGDESHDESMGLHDDKDFRRLRYVAHRAGDFDDELRRRNGRSSMSEPEKWPPERNHKHPRDPNRLPAFSEFTFTYPSPSTTNWDGRSPSPPGFASDPPAHNPFARSLSRLDIDSEDDEDERERTPTRPSTPILGASPSGSYDLIDAEDFEAIAGSAQASTSTTGLRRPPLPTMTLPPSPIPSISVEVVRGATPLESPSLATYRAPEELDADAAADRDYFVHDDDDDLQQDQLLDHEQTEEEHAYYFRDPSENDTDFDTDEEEEARARVQQDVEAQRVRAQEMAEMADEELDMDDEGEIDMDDLQWTDDDPLHEDDDDEEGEGGQGVVQIREELPGPFAGGQPPEPPLPQDDFDAEVNIEDDMDGALEAIGLRGPLVGVLQNAVLMTFILDTTIGLGIWLPFTIGKSTALLTLNPRRAVQLVHLPLRLIRLVTDPIVDSVLLLISKLLLPSLAHFGQAALCSGLRIIASALGQDRADKLAELSTDAYDNVLAVASQIMNRTTPLTYSPSDVSVTESLSSTLYRALEEDTTVMRVVEPYFAPLGKNVREWFGEGKTSWVRFATGDTPNDRAFAVVLGYTVVGLLLAIYLNVLTVGSMRSASRAVRNAVRQQLLVVKVAAFIVVELVVFPLGCGVMLDVCTVWLFPQGSFRSRAAFLMYAPLTAVFYHWVLGTMFMYQFAVLLSGCRGIMRPGAMWFIKDPQDQNFHPIRDILERPTLTQIRKLVLSAMMYGFVVASGVATVSGILRIFSRTIMPFRWKIREPLSEVPIDLILLQLVLPYTMESFRPRKALRRFGSFIWRYLASRLRLSSYMFGGRFNAEEFTPKHWSWRSLLIQDGIQMDDDEAPHDGGFRRVPNSDNVALVRNSPATALVLEDGTPIDEAARQLIDAQNAEAQKQKRPIKDDYTVVYIPPNFRYRVITFLVCLWTIGSVMLASVLAAPILMGRGFFRLFISHDVHDGYSFIVGFYLIWACWLISASLDRMDKRRQRRWSGTDPRAEWALFVVKRALLWIAQALYMTVTLGIIVPTLVGLVFELYIVQPIRHTANPLMEPRIRLVDMWALGLLYSKIIIRTLRMHPPTHGLMHGIDRLVRNGWTHLDPMRATKDVILPLIAGLTGMIVLPAAALWGLQRAVTLPMDGDFLFLHVYPGIFTAAGLVHGAFALSKVLGSWSQTIRDKEFLVEMRLRNLEPDQDKSVEQQEDAKEVVTEVEE
ncbi:hypothetical protein GSI_12816 [Ganoderma sinense ZZ0214-1]|uniref:RING-type E3 ubiquitin transferase n=1 Tax=Ganoderma sinense ZZ0214-1 TaxID=1077348 RepID=A0A2G8RTV2_9APHY|nr:hypothetical protein GSI_12816 [Ganoderma sinense ZZ0214-1]